MIIEEITTKRIIADKGKVFKRIFDNQILGNDVSLGYTYYIAGVKLDEPLMELPEYFIEIDDPNLIVDKETIIE